MYRKPGDCRVFGQDGANGVLASINDRGNTEYYCVGWWVDIEIQRTGVGSPVGSSAVLRMSQNKDTKRRRVPVQPVTPLFALSTNSPRAYLPMECLIRLVGLLSYGMNHSDSHCLENKHRATLSTSVSRTAKSDKYDVGLSCHPGTKPGSPLTADNFQKRRGPLCQMKTEKCRCFTGRTRGACFRFITKESSRFRDGSIVIAFAGFSSFFSGAACPTAIPKKSQKLDARRPNLG